MSHVTKKTANLLSAMLKNDLITAFLPGTTHP